VELQKNVVVLSQELFSLLIEKIQDHESYVELQQNVVVLSQELFSLLLIKFRIIRVM
jgi:hypothetical protein